jgi:hypothetical protein
MLLPSSGQKMLATEHGAMLRSDLIHSDVWRRVSPSVAQFSVSSSSSNQNTLQSTLFDNTNITEPALPWI